MKYDDVSKIYLDDKTQAVFDKFRQSDTAHLDWGEFELLNKKHLIKDSIDGKSTWTNNHPGSGLCVLSDLGMDLRAYQQSVERAAKKADRRYWINTTIAVAALIISATALLLQFLWH